MPVDSGSRLARSRSHTHGAQRPTWSTFETLFQLIRSVCIDEPAEAQVFSSDEDAQLKPSDRRLPCSASSLLIRSHSRARDTRGEWPAFATSMLSFGTDRAPGWTRAYANVSFYEDSYVKMIAGSRTPHGRRLLTATEAVPNVANQPCVDIHCAKLVATKRSLARGAWRSASGRRRRIHTAAHVRERRPPRRGS
jgi:hypothetical protein